jgi:hypothetical protein
MKMMTMMNTKIAVDNPQIIIQSIHSIQEVTL